MEPKSRPSKPKKTRVSVTMTKPYLDFVDGLIERGIYFRRGDVVLASLRRMAKDFGFDLPYHSDT